MIILNQNSAWLNVQKWYFLCFIQAAGLKHVEVINGDEGFYPEPMKDYGNLYEYCRIGLRD